MTRLRRLEILEYCKDWQNQFPDMSLKDCFFTIYDDKMMTGKELDYLMNWMTL